MKLYLASTSPRRKKILRGLGFRFKSVIPDYDEGKAAGVARLPAGRLVRAHAFEKAAAAVRPARDGVILGADTIVWFRGRALGKPSDLADARKTLGALQGRWHTVYTGVALLEVEGGRIRRRKVYAETTDVLLRRMAPSEVSAYLRRVNPLDKAGSYAIQSGVPIVERVRGSFFNAMGLPAESLLKNLERMGFRRKR